MGCPPGFGSLPMMAQPQYIQQPMPAQPQFGQAPTQAHPGQRPSQPQAPPWPPGSQPIAKQPQPKQAQPKQVTTGPATATQPILARGKPYDDPPPAAMSANNKPVVLAPVSLPSPHELGVAPKATAPVAAKVDWNAMHERLNQLGSVGMQMAKMSDGRYRIDFVLRTSQAGVVQHIEALGATEAEAVGSAMARVEEWAACP